MVIGFVVGAIRIKYLKEIITEEGAERGISIPRILKESYLSIFGSIKWMNMSLKAIVLLEFVAVFFVAMSAPFWVVYASQVVGLTEYRWGLVMLISGLLGISMSSPSILGASVRSVGLMSGLFSCDCVCGRAWI